MKKIEIDVFRCEFKRDNYLFILTLKDNIITIKRINNSNSYFREKIVVDLNNMKIDINTSPATTMTYTKVDELLHVLYDALKTHYILYDLIDLKELFELINLNYKEIIYRNDVVGITSHFYNSKESNVYIYDIVLLETNEIIGNIRIFNKDNYTISFKSEYTNYKDFLIYDNINKILKLENNS